MSESAADTIELLSSEDVSRTIARIAHQIIEKTAVDSTNAQPLLLLGIPSGGVPLARRLAEKIHQFTGVTVPVGSLDITLIFKCKGMEINMRLRDRKSVV